MPKKESAISRLSNSAFFVIHTMNSCIGIGIAIAEGLKFKIFYMYVAALNAYTNERIV